MRRFIITILVVTLGLSEAAMVRPTILDREPALTVSTAQAPVRPVQPQDSTSQVQPVQPPAPGQGRSRMLLDPY